MVRGICARGNRNPADIFLRKVITRLPRSLGIANYVCVCARARADGYGSCVRNDGHYVYRIRVMERIVVRNAFDYVAKDVYVRRWRSMLSYEREMQNGFFAKLI